MNYAIYPSNKKKSTALILCIFGGYMGLHQFYVGKAGKGVLYLCTAGLCGIGWFVDIFKILSGTFHDSTGALLKDDLFLQIPRGNNTIQKFYGEQRPPYIPPEPAPTPAKTFSQDYDSMEGHDFEFFCAELLKKNGFLDVEVTKGSGDQGIDIIAFKDGIKYGVQCKCYSSDIGNKAVQEAFSGKTFYHCHVASVLTNRYFTASAKELAESNGILLWDRDYLNNLLEKSRSSAG